MPWFLFPQLHVFGSRREKLTAIWTSVEEILQLQRVCDDSHEHEAWGVTQDGAFATAQECAYDPVLCANWANAIVEYARCLGYHEPPATLAEVAAEHLHVKDLANRAITGGFASGKQTATFAD